MNECAVNDQMYLKWFVMFDIYPTFHQSGFDTISFYSQGLRTNRNSCVLSKKKKILCRYPHLGGTSVAKL